MCHGCSWAIGAHMTKFSTEWAGVRGACALRVSWGDLPTERAYVLRAVGVTLGLGRDECRLKTRLRVQMST